MALSDGQIAIPWTGCWLGKAFRFDSLTLLRYDLLRYDTSEIVLMKVVSDECLHGGGTLEVKC
jgi:hypothetical protein